MRYFNRRKMVFWGICFCFLLYFGYSHIFIKPKSKYESLTPSPYCGIVSVVNICSLYGIETNMSEVYQYTGVGKRGTSLFRCKRALENLGVRCLAVRFRSVSQLPLEVPILCVLRGKDVPHAVVIICRPRQVVMVDGQKVQNLSAKELDQMSEGIGLITERKEF